MVSQSTDGAVGTLVFPEPASASPTSKRLGWRTIDMALLSIGVLLNLFAYLSFLPIVLAFLWYSVGQGVLIWPKLGGLYERRIFSRVFAVGFLMAGVAAIYANYWHDPTQLASDADTFYRVASGQTSGITLDELRVFFEGALAIVLWGAIYDFFAALGFPRERYVGILFNVVTLAATGVLSIKISRQIYGADAYRFKRLIDLFAACGLFWMFASIHIRDAIVLLVATALVYAWLAFLAHPGLGLRFLRIFGASIAAAFFFRFLRGEFVFVPVAMAMAGVAALMFGQHARLNRLTGYLLLLIGLAAISGLLVSYGEAIQLALARGQAGYVDLASDVNTSDSLGMALIINQPLPIRLALGSITLLLSPIPFWVGFQLESAYHLFKSFNVLFFYFLMPLLALSIRELWKRKSERTPAFLFILFVAGGFILAIAGTSLESRHLGAFLAPIFILALLPDLRVRSVNHNYRQLLMVMLGGVAVVHGLWVILKLA